VTGNNGHGPVTPDDRFAVKPGQVRYPFTQPGDWVLYANISDRAFRVYALLMSHINHERDDDRVWPSQATLASVLGLTKGDQVGEAIRELVAIGAVIPHIVSDKDGRYTQYEVMREPIHDDWRGPRRSADIYKPGVLEEIREERVKKRPYQVGKSRRVTTG
jgi:hypothetical protein